MESDRARADDGSEPSGLELAKDAYGDLVGVVGRVSEQLASFRRRALSAESRVRDLERALAVAEQSLEAERAGRAADRDGASRADAEQRAARRAAERALADERAQRTKVEAALVQAEARLAAGPSEPAASRPTAAPAVPPPPDRRELVALAQENAALRGRLEEATARTRGILDRVRFLRQQVGDGESA